ncbi:hypothetical protein OFAG_02220 [Oxalobacter formigenes HOxBLS]|uniref:Uncharacterized protein n=1 Tax=Oxalobacter paraformigenes TaxID=556268 RepID=T5LT47_9BURK|nr:hypothetical protein OFAG_02220 [Oxalobacter paraformigenes]
MFRKTGKPGIHAGFKPFLTLLIHPVPNTSRLVFFPAKPSPLPAFPGERGKTGETGPAAAQTAPDCRNGTFPARRKKIAARKKGECLRNVGYFFTFSKKITTK